MATAMRDGPGAALHLAAGVITGSLVWAILAATGLSAVLAVYADALVVIRILGGVYLFVLAFRAGRFSMRQASPIMSPRTGRQRLRSCRLYRQGVLMHVANPKTVLAWIAIMVLGLRHDAPAGVLPAIIGGCTLLGVFVFGGYAVLFSTAPMIALYGRWRRWIEGGLFAGAGLKLIAAGRS